MGNKSITERIESASKVNLVSKFNIEDLIDNTLLDSIYDEFKNQSALSFEIDEAYKADFTEFNEQKNEFLSDLIKDRVIKEINEAITTGFSTPDFFIEELKEPRFEKYFQVKEKGDAGEYFKKQYKKFFILYLYYKIKTQDLEVTKKDFYESLDSYFGKTSTSEKFFEFETGLRMTFSIMKDLGKTNPKLLYTSLKSLYQSFVTTECENRRKVDVFDYYAEEELFNEIRTYLIGLLTDRNSTDSIQEICIKLILLIGNIRGSGEDFLIAFNLINKHGYEFNIDAELSQCKFIDSSSHDLKEGEADDRLKVSYEGNKSAHILKGGDIDFDFNVEINMTFDSQFIYAYQHGKGLLKLGASDSAATKLGRLISKNSSFSDDHRSFMYLNGKLYCRFKNSDGKPFTLINTETLEEITNNEEFNKKIEALKEKGPEEEKKEAEPEEDEKTEEDKKPEETPTLGWTKEDSEEELKGGRYLCASPLFTDGVDIYVISTIREVKIIRKEDENLDEDRKELAITKWNLEVYDGSTWKFKKSVEIQLDIKHRGIDEHMTEAEEKEIDAIKQLRESFNANHLAYCSFATNGTKLLVGENNRWHSYDINKLKWNFNLELTEGNWAYNYMANTFWQITSSPEVKSFKIPAFKRLETGISHSKGIIEYINNKVKDIQKLQTVADKLTKRTPKNLFKNLMKKADEQTKNPIFETKTKADYSQFLILNILKEGSKELITIAENINPNGPVDNKKLELFRGSFSTAVTGTFFSELLNAVEGSVGLLSKKQKKSSNILEQYNFYMILILLRTSMMCLSKLNIPISTVLYERNDFDRLVKIVEQNISVMVSKEAIDYTIEDGNAHEELSCIWSSIESECRSIMSYCLSLVYESLEDLMRKVTSLLERMDIGQSDNSLGIYINYLTLPETMNKALKSNEIKDLILVVYEKLCMLKTKKLISAIDSVKYETHQLHDVEYSSLEISNEGFIYAVTQNIINLYFEAYRDVEKQKEQSKSDKDKLEMLERKLERTEFDLIKVLERISESTIQILDKCSSSTQYYLDEALKQQKEDDKIEDQEKKPKVTGKMKYVEFHRYLYKIAHLNNNFPNLMHVYVAAFASLKDSTNVKTLSLLSIKILKVIENFSKFKEIVSEDLPLSESEDLLRNNLDKDIIKFFVWTISKLSYSFINVKKVAELSEEEKMNKKILDSKLLSGGIENRFLPILSKDTVSSLRDLCEITADRTIKEYLVNDPKELDEDQVFMAIIHQGKDKNIDRVIDLLQFNMERKHPWAKSAKEEGMRLSRAAFACMIKIGELYTDFIMMVDETEMNADSVDADDEATAKKQLAQELSKIDSYETIFKHWESSAKMRSWYQEKKKSWANKIKKEEEEKKKKDEADSKTTEENKDKENKDKDKENKEKDKVKPKDEKEDKKDDGEEVIDTTTKPTDDNQPKKKTKDQIELAKIIEKVVEKAELLIKLNMPTSWGSKEQTKFNMIETLAEEEEKKIHSSEVKEEIPDWKTRLDKWREIQESAGSIRNFEEQKAAIFSSSTTSILACLQTPISAQRIKKQIETIYLNALKRICGFRLIARLSYMKHSTEIRTEYLNWFCSSLRHNTNILSHYSNDVTGCGEHLRNELRKGFFLVFNGIVKQIGECTDESEIKFLLNCCKWQFSASDHDDLIKSGIFEILSQGNGKKEKDKNPIKYCWGHNFKYDSKEDYPLCQDVLDLFEQVLMACFARIIKKDGGEEQKLKTSGTSIPGMEKAHSLVNTTTTEGLIAKGFKHVFDQLERYIKLTKKFEGIDWEFYVSKRNNQRKKGDKIEEIETNELEDENEPVPEETKEPEATESVADSESVVEEAKKEETEVKPAEVDNEETKDSAIPDDKVEETKEIKPEEDTKENDDPNEDAEDAQDDNEGGNEEEVKDKVREKVEEKENKEIEKLKKLYEEKYITRFLKLIEIFTSIAADQKGVLGMVLKIASPQELTILVDLLVYAAPRHGFTILKIFDNLFRIKVPHELFDESIIRLSKIDGSLHQKIMNINLIKIDDTKQQNKFENTPFLRFLFNYIVSIRAAMWNDSHFEGSGSFILSSMMLGILRTILNNDIYPKYQKEIINAIDHLIDNIDKYNLEEFEPLISVLNGAEYLGLGLGTNGVSSDGSMFTVLGFVQKWYGLKTQDDPNNNQNDDEFVKHRIQSHLEDKNDHILALYYDPKHPERTDIFTAIPEEVRLIPRLEKETNKILLDKTRINKFLRALKLDEKLDKGDYIQSTKRSIGLKILEQYLVDHGEELSKLIDTEFYNSFLKLLYSEACSPSSGKSTMQNDWIEQKIHALQEYAAENNSSLRTSSDTKARFADKKMVLSKVLKSAGNQRYSKCIDLVSAMNYGRVIQAENYRIAESVKLPEKDEDLSKIKEKDLRLIDPSEISTVDLMCKHLKTAKILLSCDVDIESMHKGLVEKDSEIAYFKSIVIVSKKDFMEIKQFLAEDPKIKVVNTEGLSSYEAFIKEMVEYGGFERKTLEEILKGNEEAPLSRKSNLVSDWCKQQEEKKDKEKKDKAEESKNSKEEVKEEKKEEKKEKDAKEMKDKKEEIKEEIIDTKEVKVKEGEKHDKDKKEESKEDKEAFDEETIFNLEKNDKFTKIFETVSKYGSTNYDDSANKPKKQRGTLFNNVYNVNSDNVEGEYLNCIGTYFVSMCRKTILSFFKISQVDNLLKLLLSSKHDTENFIKFVKIIGNELVLTKLNMIDDKPYEDLKGILGNIIKSCISNKEFTPFLHQLFKDVIVNGSIKGLKTALEAGAKDVKSYFNNETVAIETMNFYILVDLVNLYIKECPDLIFENHDLFKKFMTMLFLIPCVFRNDGKLQKNVYLSILKIVVLVDQSIEKGTYSKKIREHLLSLKIFKKLIECINFEKDSANSYNFKLTDEHKLLFEIFLKFSSIHKASAKDGIEPIYTYTESLLQMERCKIILKERKQFDMISYLMYLNELDDASKQSTILVDSQHPHFVPKVTACLKNEGFKKMTLKVQSGSELEKYSSVAITSDRKGENILKNIYQKDITDNKTEVTIFSDACYIHYPFRQPKIIAFGDKDQNKLGTDASSDPTKEPEVVPDLFEDLKCLANHQSFTAALDSKGVLYEAGFKTTFSQTYTKFTKHVVNGFKENEDKLVKMVAGFENIILLTEKGKIFIEGSNEQYQIDDSGDKYQFTEKKIPNDDDPVIDVSAGRCHHLIVTKSGKLYGAGNYFLKDIKIECGKKYAKIDLPNNAKALRVFCTNVEKPCVAFVLVEVKKGKTELWSAGESSKGLLGQGENTKKSGTFARLDYEHEKLNFVEVFAKYDHAMALTDDGQLYGWGCNIQHRLGLKKEGDKFKPTHIAFFKDYIVENVSVGMSHSLVIASPKTDKSKKMVFSIGKEEGVFSHYGITEEDSKNMEEIITHLKSFDHLEPYLIEAGNKTSFVAFRGDKLPSSGVSVHQEAKCEITGESPIQGIMYFYKDADNKMHCFSEKGYAKAKDTLPGIMFATKYPLKNLKCKFPKLKEGDLLISKDSDNDAKYPLYITNLKLGDKPLTKVELTETEFHNSNVNDIDPLVYYRISRPLAEGKELPVMNLSDYFDQTKQKGLSIELSPDYSYLKNDKIIDKAKETYKEIYDQVVKFPKQCDRELLECLEKHIKDNDLNFDETNSSKIEISPSSLTFKNKKLKGLPDKTKQQRINALLMYNQYFLKTIPYVLLDEDTLSQMATSRDAMSDKLNELFIVGKALAFSSIKNKYIKNIVNNLPCNWDQPECKIKRRKAQRFQDSGKVDHKGEYTIFGQIWSTLKKTNYNSLKKNDANTKAWSASLVGEGSIDGGGPYRETITNLCGELMHNVLPLLIPTPNNKNDHGLNRDCWTINPSAKSPTHLEMYEFLGALMGMAFRSGQILDLKLTSFFYKSLAGEPLTIEDLKAIDLYAVQAIKEIENTKKNVTEEMFDSYGAQTMTTRLSNQEEVDLIPKGKEITLKYKDIDEFVRLTLDARFKEAEKQMQAIRKGFEIVFPTTVMGILTWREVEYRIIGPTEIDMEELKKITNYSCCSETDEYVQRFWRAFEGFTQEERSMYLKFVWGRSRLPPPDSSGIQRHVIYLMYAGQYADHNQVLPQAHTCFFQLDLPRYTTDAACRDKVLYAIETCGEIDTDGYGRYADEDE